MKRAFSLVEVLIAILVLGLGMLGLGAVFPAVISEQRRSFDSISGESVARQVEALLRDKENGLVDLSPLRSPGFGRIGVSIADDAVGRPVNVAAGPGYDYLWVMDDFARIDGGATSPWASGSPVPGAGGPGDLFDGMWRSDSRESAREFLLPVSARLHPLPSSGLDPAYVWDVVARRHPSGGTQFAVFVRRINDRIPVPQGRTLSDVLTGRNTNRLLPFAVDTSTGRLVTPSASPPNPQAYPMPMSLEAYVDERQPSWLVLRNAEGAGIDTSVSFVRRVGQRLVDNTGVVRTVVGIPQPQRGEPMASEARRAVIVSPPFTRAEASNGQVAPPTIGDPEAQRRRAAWVRQVVFTPQTPVAVRVFTLDKE